MPSKSNRKSNEARRTCQIYLTGKDPYFVPEIIGRNGCNLKPISEATNSKIRVRGKSSGHIEINGHEAQVPLMISISTAATDTFRFELAVSQVVHLLEYTCRNGAHSGYSRSYFFKEQRYGPALDPLLVPYIPGLVKKPLQEMDGVAYIEAKESVQSLVA